MKTEEYLLIKNTLNLQLSIALQKFAMLHSEEKLKDCGLFGSGAYNKNTAAFQVKWYEDELIKLEKMYKDGIAFEKAVKELKWLLPSE